MQQSQFRQLAAYNAWANARLYAAALALPEDSYRRGVGVFFGSLHGTLNHLLATDRIWLKRITGSGDAPDRLDAILFDERGPLARARVAEDRRIAALAEATGDDALAAPVTYTNMRGEPFAEPMGDILMHVFNHQTHHRGQAHACLSILTGAEPPGFDLVAFRRGVPAPDLAALAGTSPHPEPAASSPRTSG